MAHARAQGLIVVTHDLDFGAILAATGGKKPSVVQLRGDDISSQGGAAMLASAVSGCAEELAAGALLTLDVARSRLTLLPLRT